MKLYEVVFDEKSDEGVYALSCVDNPAMEDKWITLKDHPKEIQFEAVDQEKRLLLGAALIPNKRIYRNMDGEEFYITFNEDVIEACAHSFVKRGLVNNSSINHDIKLDGVSVVQSWIVDDPAKDKSALYGKTYEKGTWVTMMKVENEEAWEKAKKGELNGFSIDGLFSLKELTLKDQKMAEEKSKFDQILAILKGNKKEVKMGQLKLKDGKTIVEFEGDAPEVGMPVFVLSEDKQERFRAPEGRHETETGEFLAVDSNGLLVEDKVEEVAIDEELVSALAAMLKEQEEKFDAKLSEIKKSFDASLEAEKEKNKELETKLAQEPAAKKVVKVEQRYAEPKTAKERLMNAVIAAQQN